MLNLAENINLEKQPSSSSTNEEKTSKALLFSAALLPFFLAAASYLSLVFALFSSIPLIYAHLRFGRFGGLVASLTNTIIIHLVLDRENAAVFFVLGVVLAWAFSEATRYKLTLGWSLFSSVVAMILATLSLLVGYSIKYKVRPLEKLDTFVAEKVEQTARGIEKYRESNRNASQDLESFLIDPEMTKRNIIYNLPSNFTILVMCIAVMNILLVLRLNIRNIRQHLGLDSGFFKYWKAPDHLVWPTLACVFCLVLEVPGLSDIALNVFKILLAVYAIQGLAILNYMFDVWGVKPYIRPLAYMLSVGLLTPLIIVFGFFDLWFGFRDRVKV